MGENEMNEQELEELLKDKNLTKPRLTPDLVDSCIKDELYYVFPGTTTTVCCLVLRNGYTVLGESACAHPENFNEDIGRKIAYDEARNKIWALEGYLLRERMYLYGGLTDE